MAAAWLAEGNCEAFFLSGLLGVGGRAGRAGHGRALAAHPGAGPQALSRPRLTKPHKHRTRPTKKPIIPPKYPNKHFSSFQQPLSRPDPGAHLRLDYGGWKAINFDEDLPRKSRQKSVKPVEATRIVTIDAAIAAAPAAQSDDIPVVGPEVPAVPYIHSDNAALSTYQVLHHNNPAIAPAYEPSKTKFQSPQYIPRPAVPSKTVKPAPVPKYSAPPTIPPQYISTLPPQYQPAFPPKYEPAPAVAPKYEPAPAVPPKYEPEQVVLPAYTPAPPPDQQFPIVALITADSEVPDSEKFVSFSIGGNGGSPDTAVPVNEYQSTQDNTRLAKDVGGSVYVQQDAENTDELYYIFYQDPELDSSYGAKIQGEREARGYREQAGLGSLAGLYDYDEAVESFRSEREEPGLREVGAKHSSSSVSFAQNVGGKTSGFSYHL